MKTFLKIFLSLSASVIGIYFATRNVHLGELKEILSNIRLLPLVYAALIAQFTYWLRGVRWKILLSPFQDLKVFPLVKWQIGGIFINNLLPLRMGEFARAYWAGHKTNIPKSTVLATIVIERLLDIGSIAVLGIACMLILGTQTVSWLTPRNVMIGGGMLVAGAAGGLFWITRIETGRFFGFFKARLPEKIYLVFEKFLSGLQVVKSKKELAKLAILSPVIWAIDVTAMVVVAQCMDLQITWLQCVIVMTGLILGVMVPAAPGAAGTFEAGGVAALSLFSIDKTVALSYVLLLHGYQYAMITALGLPILISEGFNPKTILKEEKGAVTA